MSSCGKHKLQLYLLPPWLISSEVAQVRGSAAPRHTRAPSATSAGGRGRTRSAPTTRHQGEGYQVSTSGDHRRPQPPPDPPLPQNQINYLILQQVATRSAGAALRSIGMCWLSGIPMINPEITATGCSPPPQPLTLTLAVFNPEDFSISGDIGRRTVYI